MLEKQALLVFRHLVNCSPNSCFGLRLGVFRLSLPEPNILSIPYARHHFNLMKEGYFPLSVVPFIALTIQTLLNLHKSQPPAGNMAISRLQEESHHLQLPFFTTF